MLRTETNTYEVGREALEKRQELERPHEQRHVHASGSPENGRKHPPVQKYLHSLRPSGRRLASFLNSLEISTRRYSVAERGN